MPSKIPDIVKFQEAYAQNAAAASARLLDAWSRVLASSGMTHIVEHAREDAENTFWKVPDCAAAAMKLEKMIEMSAKDLPKLLENRGDSRKIRKIAGKWTESYQNFVRDLCGIPARTEAERLADQWSACGRILTHAVSGPVEPFRSFFGLPAPFSFPDYSRGGDPFRMWMRGWEQVMTAFFPAGNTGSVTRHIKMIQDAVDAQVKFVNVLLSLHEKLAATSRGAVENILESLQKKIQQINPESYTVFHETWLLHIEAAFAEFLKSEPFGRVIAEAVKSGTEAREKTERVFSDGFSLLRPTGAGDTKELSEIIQALEKRIQALELQVGELTRKNAEPCDS
ncbi:MAG TPA: poly(R)-hydroxyalkanoic acid synthase subunit PhaE [Desulfomonilaceae bacterium]|nr:poly(R)-hydroxyalkanoic acid synthase subunit PhaE [Desulfomonilaceae bacterium]